jgi:hypothetical protein
VNGLSVLETFLAFGIAGFGIGLGLTVGAFVARTLRRYMRDEGMKPYSRDDDDL